jgi:cytochrome c
MELPMFSIRLAMVLVLAGMTAGCDDPRPDVTVDAGDPATVVASDGPAGAAARGAAPLSFGICRSCHSVEKGQTIVGPSLWGIYGTRMGDVPGYDFSAGMKASGLILDDATLDAWLANPAALVPGTRTGHAIERDPAQRRLIIAYLKTLH